MGEDLSSVGPQSAGPLELLLVIILVLVAHEVVEFATLILAGIENWALESRTVRVLDSDTMDILEI